MRIKLRVLFTAAACCGMVAGCSVISANNKELMQARGQMTAGKWEDALAAVDAKKRNDLCAILDRAVIQAAQGHPAESNAEFDRALAQIKEYERRATVSATGAAAGAGSLFLNDKVLEYQGEGFEKVLISTLKARNYLMLGQEEEARVEIRNANMRQDQERKSHQDAIEKAKEDGEKAKVNFAKLSQEIDKQFASSSGILSRLDNVYQNPFATYLSAVVYELNGEPDQAFVDLKNAYQTIPNPLVAADLTQIARRLHREDELANLKIPVFNGAPTQTGNTLVLIDNGLAPERAEIKFPIPEPDTVLFAAVPITRPIPTNLSEVEILNDSGAVIGKTQMMVDIEAMAVRNLHDHYPAILVRQAIRLAGKAAVANVAKKEGGVGAEIVTSIFNAVTEQADLRGWYALPRSIHVARVNVPAGEDHVKLRFLDGSDASIREIDAPVLGANTHLKLVAARYIQGQVTVSTPPGTKVALGTEK